MSEEKMIKHSENALKILKDKSVTIREKIVGFIEEIIIIILAVSITLMLHNWNDRRHEREMVRNFLMGIKEDLKIDTEKLTYSIASFQPTLNYYDTVWKQMNSKKIDAPYIDSLTDYLGNTFYFTFDGSRFEGFKSSGYLRLIENQQLLKHLLRLYSVEMPFQKDADVGIFAMRKQDFVRYIAVKSEIDSSGNIHLSKLLRDPAVRYHIFEYQEVFRERKQQKEAMRDHMRDLITEIEQELKKDE